MKKAVIGILAPVDAGKTTLSEGMLYESGTIRKMGRVDTKDAFLDTYDLEKKRGITIFSKQAIIKTDDMEIVLLDTPGHIDFSAETERTLQVIDYAILVVSAPDGVQPHTETLWNLLYDYDIPVFLFVNKTDQTDGDRDVLLSQLNNRLGGGIIDFSVDYQELYEEAALQDESLLEYYLTNNELPVEMLAEAISNRKIFPCIFGSALKLEGIREFLQTIERYTRTLEYPESFGARIYKITRDEQNNRLTFLKVTGGQLKVKDILVGTEKINQIRIYSGAKYESTSEIHAGEICAVTGPITTYAGQGLGYEEDMESPLLKPVLTYRVLLPEEVSPEEFLPKLKTLEEEEPLLNVIWNDKPSEIQIAVMGEIQLQVLHSLILDKYGISVSFDEGSILYKETISTPAYGIGHFEPLRHYAEVHLLMEPLPANSGLIFETDCREEILDKNWQRLVFTHLAEKQHVGVLTGSPITDMRITLVSGRAHNKHTEGGDFRQAVYRGVRQGLMSADCTLLEPYYEFRLLVPQESLGRAMTDLDRMGGKFKIMQNESGTAELKGVASVNSLRNYQSEVLAYTKGEGRLQCIYAGYFKCQEPESIIKKIDYDPDSDIENPSDSVFCSHGAGFIVPWNEVPRYMHMPYATEGKFEKKDFEYQTNPSTSKETYEEVIGIDEIDAILEQAAGSNRRKDPLRKKRRYKEKIKTFQSKNKEKIKKNEVEYLLVDGYNIIYAWEEMKALIPDNMEGARGKLLDLLCDYQAVKCCEIIAVFDAYRVKGHDTEICDYHNIHVVFTKEAETADQYIEKFAHSNKDKYKITVATSDGMEQLIIRGADCMLFSARELREEIHQVLQQNLEQYESKKEAEDEGIYHSMKDIFDNIIVEEESD